MKYQEFVHLGALFIHFFLQQPTLQLVIINHDIEHENNNRKMSPDFT